MISNKENLARPYAEAIFVIAVKESKLAEWSSMLSYLSSFVKDKDHALLISDPRLSVKNKVLKLFQAICIGKDNEPLLKFLELLLLKHKLAILPSISKCYDAKCAEHKNILDVTVTSARYLLDTQKQRLELGLRKRFNKSLSFKYELDTNLIGGIKIMIGNDVIDGSIFGKLERLGNIEQKHFVSPSLKASNL